ncbi:hypothetical protein M441DRAFT_76729, partial [Trichoderma asperellum CBS 433.97]
ASNLHPTRGSHIFWTTPSQTCVGLLLSVTALHPFACPGPGPQSIWTINKALPHRPRSSSARLRDRQFDDAWPAPPAYPFGWDPTGGAKSRDGKRPKLL